MAMAAAIFLIFLVAAPAVHAVDHVVGGSNGWSTSGDYSTWAAGETFTVGDTLLFSYGGSHSVDEVNQADYNNCASGNALNSYTGGQNTISLKKAGPMYFLCPSFGHCSQGMKLSINVVAANTTSDAAPTATPTITPAASPSPSTHTTPTTTTTTTRSSPSPPASSGAAGSFVNINHMMLVFLAPVLVFIG